MSTMRTRALQAARGALQGTQRRSYSAPRHLMSIGDLTAGELAALVRGARARKEAVKAGSAPAAFAAGLAGRSVAMMFSKRSTRTRVSTEAAVAMMGGHAMFLGRDDIQLGVNESLYDTSVVVSSMTACMVARVGPHADVAELARHSSVPVVNALSDDFHPLQTVADLLTMHEALAPSAAGPGLGLDGLRVAWVGDSNNVLFDLATGCVKAGVDIAVASPPGYGIPPAMRRVIAAAADGVDRPGRLEETTAPEEAVRGADVIVTDTWVSMGQEADQKKRLAAFAGYQVTDELARRGGAKDGWRFMHCLPRHREEVADDVFYGPRSLVFPEAENRLWAAVATLEALVVNKGRIEP